MRPATFQPISSESGLRHSPLLAKARHPGFSTHIQRKRIATQKMLLLEQWKFVFSTHIQRKRIATILYIEVIILKHTFQPISSESGLRHKLMHFLGCFTHSFQPISSESGLRRLLHLHWQRQERLFNPYPAKADCDIQTLRSREQRLTFSTHIQRKRIATFFKADI